MQDQQIANQEVQALEAVTTPQIQEVSQSQPTKAENHLYSMRKKLEAEEEARKAVEKRNQELEAAMRTYQQQPSSAQEEDDLGVDNEDYVQAKHIKTSNKKLSRKLTATEQRIQELEQKLNYFEAKVDTDTLKDFDQVVSDDNLKTFARLYPDDYQTMMMQPNLKVKSKTAYNMIKNYGILDMANNVIDSRITEDRLTKNKQKPQAASNASPQQAQTPLTRLDDYERRILSDADRDRIMAEVERKKMKW